MTSIEEALRRIVREDVRAALAEWQPLLRPVTGRERELTVGDVAEWLQVAPRMVRDWRVNRKGPPALKFGSSVRYQLEDVEGRLVHER